MCSISQQITDATTHSRLAQATRFAVQNACPRLLLVTLSLISTVLSSRAARWLDGATDDAAPGDTARKQCSKGSRVLHYDLVYGPEQLLQSKRAGNTIDAV